MLAMGVLSAGVCYVELRYLKEPVELSNAVHSLLGFVLALFGVPDQHGVRPLVGRTKAVGRIGERVTHPRHPRTRIQHG